MKKLCMWWWWSRTFRVFGRRQNFEIGRWFLEDGINTTSATFVTSQWVGSEKQSNAKKWKMDFSLKKNWLVKCKKTQALQISQNSGSIGKLFFIFFKRRCQFHLEINWTEIQSSPELLNLLMKLGRRWTLLHVGQPRTLSQVLALSSDCRQQNEEEVLFVGGMYELAGGEGTNNNTALTSSAHCKQTHNLLSQTCSWSVTELHDYRCSLCFRDSH